MAGPREPRRIVVMCDYFADPIWTSDRRCSLDLDAFPLSDGTKTALRAWARWYDSLLDRDFHWPADERLAWSREGRRLWRIVADELGGDYAVAYYDSDVAGDRTG